MPAYINAYMHAYVYIHAWMHTCMHAYVIPTHQVTFGCLCATGEGWGQTKEVPRLYPHTHTHTHTHKHTWYHFLNLNNLI